MKFIPGKNPLLAGTFVALLLCGAAAQAAFVAPSYFGQANSTSSSWVYNGNWGSGNSASHLSNFNAITGYPLTAHDGGCGAGVACLSTANNGNTLDFFIPNFVDPLPIKHVRVQTMFERSALGDPAIGITGFDPFSNVQSQLVSSVFTTEVIGQITYTFGIQDWILRPNPDWEIIHIDNANGSSLREVRIDTISVPEPSSLWLAGLALSGLLLPRTRKQH